MDYCVYENVLPEELIKKIVSTVDKKQLYEGKVGNRVDYKQKIRYDLFINQNSLLSEIDNIIYDKMYQKILNDFKRNIKYREQWKVGKYVAEKEGFYNYHRDDSHSTKYRSMSCVLALSEPSEYEGGELHLKDLDLKFKLKKNSMIFFRSSILHGVSKVTSGNRYVLIGFMFDEEGKKLKEKLDVRFKNNVNSYVPILEKNILDYYYTINGNNLDKDYADYYKKIFWTDKDDYYLEDNDSDTLLVSFAGMGMKQSIPTFIFYNFLKRYNDIDKLFLRDIKQRYYMTGLCNSADDFHKTIDLIKNLTSKKKYSKIVAIGCSAGAFAAILFSQLLGFNKVVAFSPQVVLNEKKDTIIKDVYNAPQTCKWLTTLKKYQNDKLYHKCLDLSNFKPYKAEIDIHYAQRANRGVDKTHAEYLKDEMCKIYEHNSNNHMIALELRDAGKLEDILENLIYSDYQNSPYDYSYLDKFSSVNLDCEETSKNTVNSLEMIST